MIDEFIVSSDQTSLKQIEVAELQLGIKFSSSFVEFVIENNGAKLADAEISLERDQSTLGPFGLRNFLDVGLLSKRSTSFHKTELIPFAEDSSGNFFVFIKSEMKGIYFWDHETDETVQLADCFSDFLASISKVDHAALPDPENASGWIDADFLASLKK